MVVAQREPFEARSQASIVPVKGSIIFPVAGRVRYRRGPERYFFAVRGSQPARRAMLAKPRIDRVVNSGIRCRPYSSFPRQLLE